MAGHPVPRTRLRRLTVTIQPIEHDGQLVALVAGGRALIDEQSAGDALALVQAKCLYALEIEAQTLPGPYAEPAASRFARDVLAAAKASLRSGPPAIRVSASRGRRVNA